MNINTLHPWHGTDFGKDAPKIVNAIIEIPKGSRAKYEIDKATGLLKLDRVIYSSFHYPINYGFIPKSLGEDKDPLDKCTRTICGDEKLPAAVKSRLEGYLVGVESKKKEHLTQCRFLSNLAN